MPAPCRLGPMTTDRLTDALAELARFPLLDALYGRRSRRFPMGGEIPDGPLAYRSQHEHVPLSDLEMMLILATMAGTTGWHFGSDRHGRSRGSSASRGWSTRPSRCRSRSWSSTR